MTYISLAAHNNELIVIKDMDTFTTYFCYSKKQRQGKINITDPETDSNDDADTPAIQYEIDDKEIPDEDDV